MYVFLVISCLVIFSSHIILSKNFIETELDANSTDILIRKVTLVFRIIMLFLDITLAYLVIDNVRFYIHTKQNKALQGRGSSVNDSNSKRRCCTFLKIVPSFAGKSIVYIAVIAVLSKLTSDCISIWEEVFIIFKLEVNEYSFEVFQRVHCVINNLVNFLTSLAFLYLGYKLGLKRLDVKRNNS